jgi:urease accessory protein UreF
MIQLLEWYGITPDKTNEEPVMYHEDIVEIWEAKQLIIKGELKREKREEARRRGRSSARKL